MLKVDEGNVVFDTTIYYKDADRVQSWLDTRDFVVHFTPNNALELMTPAIGAKGEDFQKRKQAVRNLLSLTDDGQRELPDTELLHAAHLGYKLSHSGPWAEAARKFLTLEEFTPEAWKAAGLNLQPAIDAITSSYSAFGQKIQTCQKIFQEIWSQNKEALREKNISYESMHSPEVVRGLIESMEIRQDIIAAHIARICDVAQEYQLGGSLVDASAYDDGTGIYIRAYIGYLQYSLVTSKRDKNDYGDLQFFAYCDAGYRLVSSENRWQSISIQEGLEDWLLHFI